MRQSEKGDLQMNRKLLVIILSLAFAAMLYAQDSKAVKITGYLIDNACAESAKDLATRAEGHTVSCALMDSCEKSGYSVVTDDNTRYKLSEKGDGLAAELLKSTKTTKGVKVAIEGNYNGSELDVTKLTEVVAAIN
jgi:autotransporter translocation and assembly factor TamB